MNKQHLILVGLIAAGLLMGVALAGWQAARSIEPATP